MTKGVYPPIIPGTTADDHVYLIREGWAHLLPVAFPLLTILCGTGVGLFAMSFPEAERGKRDTGLAIALSLFSAGMTAFRQEAEDPREARDPPRQGYLHTSPIQHEVPAPTASRDAEFVPEPNPMGFSIRDPQLFSARLDKLRSLAQVASNQSTITK